MSYAPPTVTDLGSVRELTLDLNKVGRKPDMYSKVVPIVGSVVTAP